jgi:hypothetical protein
VHITVQRAMTNPAPKVARSPPFELRLFSDDSVNFLLHAHWESKFPLGHLPSPEEDIVIQADNAEH